MRFYFCGGLDCPDWVLAQIAYASKLTQLKFRLLSKEAVSSIHQGHVDVNVIHNLADTCDIELCFSAIVFIIKSACSHHVEVETLSDELQQLGLPKEHTQALCKIYTGDFEAIRQSLTQRSLRLDSISNAQCSSVTLPELGSAIEIQLKVRSALDDSETNYSVLTSRERVGLLLDDLKKISVGMK